MEIIQNLIEFWSAFPLQFVKMCGEMLLDVIFVYLALTPIMLFWGWLEDCRGRRP